jgi:predicted XRE-type DNA-binding protein
VTQAGAAKALEIDQATVSDLIRGATARILVRPACSNF